MERWLKPEAEVDTEFSNPHVSRSSLDYHTPLRSVRGNATASPSPFYKLSSELSRESLRIPGAIPFLWEQSPGRRKFSALLASVNTTTSPPPSQPVEIVSSPATDPVKPSLAALFRQSSLRETSSPAPALMAIPINIAPPPAAEHPRSSSARFAVTPRNVPPPAPAMLHDDDDAPSEATSDAFTATAGGFSIDDSLVMSGAVDKPSSTSSDARTFIMDRFLPAAHAIACDSPQTPSRRFLPSASAVATLATPARCNGGYVVENADYAGGSISRASPFHYVSAPSTPAWMAALPYPMYRSQRYGGSLKSEEEEEEEVGTAAEEEADDSTASTPRACGMFTLPRILSFHNRQSRKQQHNKQLKKSSTSKLSMSSRGTGTRIMDILREDHDDPIQRRRTKPLPPEREHIDMAVLDRRPAMYSDPRLKPTLSEAHFHHKASPMHKILQATIDVNVEDASDCASYHDAASRFQSPSPARSHLQYVARTSLRPPRQHTSVHSPPFVISNADFGRSYMHESSLHGANRSSACFAHYESPPPAIIHTTEQHLLDSSAHYYNYMRTMNRNIHHPPPSLSARVDNQMMNHEGDDIIMSSSHKKQIQEKTSVINNVLYDQEERIKNSIHTSGMREQLVGTVYNYRKLEERRRVIKDMGARGGGEINGVIKASNGEDENIYMNGGLINGENYMQKMENMSNLLISPPLPKSPTNSWLGRAIPLSNINAGRRGAANNYMQSSTSSTNSTNSTVSTPSRLSQMHKPAQPDQHHHQQQQLLNFHDSKWEAIVKGSHLQPAGHLRFSEELSNQSESVVAKIGN